ncbi:hypothetical protein METHB2_20124 [Candidatus Methylobacter favarea]|uniref:Uncharacterized protein n=1 Tax=Candidatus Methylobacter favarea TaxID=2707345 RepID=A0A8S0XI33_9GAMM|nr:hypothetical protein METHB2_20124 [Candidatus Methylobacter favarea]
MLPVQLNSSSITHFIIIISISLVGYPPLSR